MRIFIHILNLAVSMALIYFSCSYVFNWILDHIEHDMTAMWVAFGSCVLLLAFFVSLGIVLLVQIEIFCADVPDIEYDDELPTEYHNQSK